MRLTLDCWPFCAVVNHLNRSIRLYCKPTDDRSNRSNVLFTLWREDQAFGLQNLNTPLLLPTRQELNTPGGTRK